MRASANTFFPTAKERNADLAERQRRARENQQNLYPDSERYSNRGAKVEDVVVPGCTACHATKQTGNFCSNCGNQLREDLIPATAAAQSRVEHARKFDKLFQSRGKWTPFIPPVSPPSSTALSSSTVQRPSPTSDGKKKKGGYKKSRKKKRKTKRRKTRRKSRKPRKRRKSRRK
jgi:hypothetical protein